jgi:hypothetical protein
VFVMSEKEIKELVWEIASRTAAKGPGWAQEGVVLREIDEEINRMRTNRPDLQTQMAILDAWHDLFIEKKLGWGYDLDNPNAPFFHVR